eukprot:50240-Pelagomonas_calceolata.AAC.9
MGRAEGQDELEDGNSFEIQFVAMANNGSKHKNMLVIDAPAAHPGHFQQSKTFPLFCIQTLAMFSAQLPCGSVEFFWDPQGTSEKRRFITVGRRCPSDERPFWCNAPPEKPEFRCVAVSAWKVLQAQPQTNLDVMVKIQAATQLECEQWRAIGAPDGVGENDAPGFGTFADDSEDDNDPTTLSTFNKDAIPSLPEARGGDLTWKLQ